MQDVLEPHEGPVLVVRGVQQDRTGSVLMQQGIPCQPPKDIRWLNKRSEKAWTESMAVISYGNEEIHKHYYSTACIVAIIPPFADRVQPDSQD